RRSVLGLGRWISAATVLFGLGLLAFSFAGSLWAAAVLLTTTGFALLLLTAGANTLLQSIVAEDRRGRGLSLYTLDVTGLAPVGGLLAGLLADGVGAALTLRLAGLACLTAAAVFALPRFFSMTGLTLSWYRQSALGRSLPAAANSSARM